MLSRLSFHPVGVINKPSYRIGDRVSLSADLRGAQFDDFWGREEPDRTHPHDERKELSRTPAIRQAAVVLCLFDLSNLVLIGGLNRFELRSNPTTFKNIPTR